MKKIIFLWITTAMVFMIWCDNSHNFMDINNPSAKEDLQHYVSDVKLPKINADNVIPDGLTWTRETAKWYANKYYEDNLEEYVDIAKDWLSWAKENLKWYYNNWVDEINWAINKKINWAISWELNKFKLK